MTSREKVNFKKIMDKEKVRITHCFYKENPENILAIMAEDISNSFVEPMYLQKSVVVSVPNLNKDRNIDISIWVSSQESNDSMSFIIQSFFDWRFPELKSKNTSMKFDNSKKLVLSYNNS